MLNPTYQPTVKKLVIATLLVPIAAHSVTIFDTFPDDDISRGTAGIGWNSNYTQKMGVPFVVATEAKVTDFLIAFGGDGTFRLGIQSSAAIEQDVFPSSSFLYDIVVVNPTRNYFASGLNWSLAPGTYFFVAQGESFESDGGWVFGVGPNSAYSVNGSPWFYTDLTTGALRLNGEMAPIPEPGSFATLALGLALLASRRKLLQRR